MPIIICSDCNSEMSDAAIACPKCGKPNQPVQNTQNNKTEETRKVSILLAIGIFFMPYIFSWFTLRKGHSALAKIVSLSWLIIVIAFMGGDSKSFSNYSSSSNSSSIVSVKLHDILYAYKNNEVRADNMYKNKYIKVTGYVDSVKKDLFGGLFITVGTGRRFEIPQIQASFDDSQNSVLSQLRKGQQITVVGKVEGLMMNVQMKECIIK